MPHDWQHPLACPLAETPPPLCVLHCPDDSRPGKAPEAREAGQLRRLKRQAIEVGAGLSREGQVSMVQVLAHSTPSWVLPGDLNRAC